MQSEQDAADLVNQIDTFISQNEAPQLNKLKKLAALSKQLYDFDKTITTYSDNISLYQSFFKLKSDLAAIAAQIRVDEQNRHQQQLLQQQLLDQQKQQQALQQQQDQLREQKLKLEQILRQQQQEQIEQKLKLEQELREQREQEDRIQQLQQEQQKKLLEKQLQEQRAQQEQLEQEQRRLREQMERQEAAANTPSNHLDTIVEEHKSSKTVTQESFTEINYSPPSFVRQLKNATIKEGERFTFQCAVTGDPVPNVEWFKDGLSLQDNPDYRQTIDNGVCTLTIDDPFAEDSARFTCKASNSVGAADTTGVLSVQDGAEIEMLTSPIFTKLLENSVAREGTSFEFRCFVTGNPLPTVQWFKNDVCIDNLKDFFISFNNGDALLRFEEVFLEDQAVFTCKATNPYGTEHCSAALTVERKYN